MSAAHPAIDQGIVITKRILWGVLHDVSSSVRRLHDCLPLVQNYGLKRELTNAEFTRFSAKNLMRNPEVGHGLQIATA